MKRDRQIEINVTEELFEDAPCGFIFTDGTGLLLKANRTYLRWLNIDPSEVGEKRFQDNLTVGSKIYYESHYAPLLAMQGFLEEITLELRDKEGRTIPVLVGSTLVKDENGDVLFIKSTLFNITERKRYERELLQLQKKAERSATRMKLMAQVGEIIQDFPHSVNDNAKKIAEFAVEGFSDICTIDFTSDKNWERLAEAFNVSEREIPILTDKDLVSETIFAEGRENVSNPSLAALADDIEAHSIIILPLLNRGEVHGRISFFSIQLGKIFSKEDLEFARDLAVRLGALLEARTLYQEKERAEKELRESHEWLSTTLRSIGDAVLAINPDKTVQYLNPVAENLTGWKLAEAIGRPMEEVFNIINVKTRKKAFNPVDSVLREGITVALANDTALIRRDDTEIIIEDSAAPIKDDNGNVRGAVLVFKDTTAKHLEKSEKLRLLNSLQSEKEVREKFVATLTHDLRSPLTAIKMNLQLMERKLQNPEAIATMVAKALQGVKRTDRMIQDLLDANRMRAGEILVMERKPFDLSQLARDVMADLALVHGDRFFLDAPTELKGEWNKEGLRRIFENLCNNAVKYGYTNTPIQVTLTSDDSFVIIKVHNEGDPIPQEEQEKLFQPYHRVVTAETSSQKGWGLGLTLVKGVTEAHQGEVSVMSKPGLGTTFIVKLGLISSKASEVTV